MEIMIDEEYLKSNPTHIFVFGDNLKRVGKGGAAKLRHMKNTYGFIAKKAPTHNKEDYYSPKEYESVYNSEMLKLKKEIENNPDRLYLISKLGAGLANKFGIWELVIRDKLVNDLSVYKNVKFLF